nr:reverse transcriptase domain-containing protein [Tanacetum cinerariifolium]
MEAQYEKFLDIICAVRINVPLIDVLAERPNYGKFLKELISNKHKIKQIFAAFISDESSAMIQNKVPPKLGDPRSFLIPCNLNKTFSYNALADLGASINLMPYSLYAKLSLKTLKPTKMSVILGDKSFQYPVGIDKNMLIEVGKFTFPADFVILEMEEDSKVSLILGRPFLYIANAIIRVKQKQLNHGVETERMIFNIDYVMKHSYSNDDTCFSTDVIDKILDEDFDALLDEEPPVDLKLKPLPDNLEYVFLEEPSFLPVIISSQLSKEKKNKLITVLKKHKQAFAWKTIDILGIFPSFCKHKIQLLDDKKPVVQKQRRLNPNMQEVVKKEIVKLLDTGIIYPTADSPWVSPIHCVPKKGGITVVTNKNDELVPTRTVTGIVLGHKVSSAGLEVDKAKIDVISKLPPPTNNKDTPFEFDDECQKAFELLKEKLTCVPVIVSLIWNLPFELMCDASDFVVEAVLEFDIEIKDRKGTKRVAADHLSRIENDETSNDSEVDDNFPRETLMEINTFSEPGFADFANYIVGVAVDYVSKWAEAQALPTNDARVVVTFLKKLFFRFEMPKALISDKGTHFCNKIMEKTMKRYGVNHRFSTSYHPQTSGQVENTNRALKRILEKIVKDNPAIWLRKLNDALWAFRTAYKTPTGTTPHKLTY